MKLQLPLVLSFIFVSQLYYSESKSVTFFPNTLKLTFKIDDIFKNEATSRRLDQSSEVHGSAISKIFVNSYNKVKNFIKNTDELQENEIPDNIVPDTEMEYKHSKSDEDPIIHQVNITTPQMITDTSQHQDQSSEANSSAISKIFVNSYNKAKNFINNTDTDELQENEIPDDIVRQTEMEYKHSEADEDPIIHQVSMTTPQMIALHGYPAESHTIVTDDGYILTVHRIPFSKTSNQKVSPKKTVLLHHGLFGSSVHWILAGPMKSLGYILSDAGYDVWLANVRGNTYSRAHVSKNVNSREFWDFTFHEVSQHDLPAVIDYITKFKGSDVKINYIGHSMGTTILFALLSTKPEYNKVLRAGFALAPVAYMTNIKSPLKKLAKYSNKIEFLLKILGGGKELVPQSPVLKWLAKYSRELMSIDEKRVFENAMTVLVGHDVEQFNRTLMPIILGQAAAGASTKTLVHYAQEIQHSGKFQMFDYGRLGNLRQYGTWSPPEYPLHKITLPIALFSSENDWLSSVIDVTRLQRQIVNPIEHYIVPLKKFNHVDFLWAIDAPSLVYARVLQLLGDGVSNPVSLKNSLNSTNLPNNL